MSTRTRITASVLVAFIPAIVVVVLIALTQQSTLYTKRPSRSDEVIYWSQVATFRAAGLAGGYYTANEHPPALERFHFYAWGPAAPVFYGTLSLLTGWQFYTPILIHLALLGIATLVAINLARLEWQQIGWVALILMTFPPLVMYVPTLMLQVLNQAVAVVLALMVHLYITREPRSRRLFILTVIAITTAAIFRMTWSLLLIPLFILPILDRFTFRRAIGAAVIVLGLISGVVMLSSSWSAPFPNAWNNMTETASVDLLAGLQGLFDNVTRNIELTFEGNTAQIILRLQMLVIVVFATIELIRALRVRDTARSHQSRYAIAHLLNLVGIFAFVVLVYDMERWRDYRVFAPHLLFSLCLLIFARHARLVMGSIAISLIAYAVIWPQYLVLLNDFDPDSHETFIEQTTRQETQYQNAGVRFVPDATSPWCNTVLYTTHFFANSSSLFAFEDGIGLSLLLNVNDLQTPPRSRYLLLDDRTATRLNDKADMKLLVDLPAGALYENLDFACGAETEQ